MALFFFAIIGAVLGYRLHTTRAGYAAMVSVALAFPMLQIILVVTVRDAESRTMLPLVVGLTLVMSMVVGAIVRSKFSHSQPSS